MEDNIGALPCHTSSGAALLNGIYIYIDVLPILIFASLSVVGFKSHLVEESFVWLANDKTITFQR
jgi:hypothetical protein